MIWLSGSVRPELLALRHPRIGAMFNPNHVKTWALDQWPMFGADNGGYGGKFRPERWLPWLDLIAPRGDRCLFAAVPDRFDPDDLNGNFPATQDLWGRWHQEVIDRGLKAAWVAQNGATPDDIPPFAEAVFIGGDTKWKLSERAWAIVACAKAHGLWVHVGRVNGMSRFRAGQISNVDSADGNLLKFGYDANLPTLIRWLDTTDSQPHLALFGS